MRIFLYGLYSLFLVLLLSGCFQITETYTLNPDGSGKVVHEAVLPIKDLKIQQDLGREIKLKKEILGELKNAKGVEVWKDVTYRYEGEDSIYFKATAYFKDISKLKFYNTGTTLSFLNLIDFICKDGQLRLELKDRPLGDENNNDREKTAKKQNVELTDAEIEQELKKSKKELSKIKMMLAGLLSDLNIDRTFYLPGKMTYSSNFERLPDGSWRNNFEGDKLLELITTKFDDEEWLRQQIRTGQDAEDKFFTDKHTIFNHLFGEKAPILLIMGRPDRPLFDYKKEVSQAKIDYQTFIDKLEPFRPPVPIKVDPSTIGKFSVVGVRHVSFSDSSNGIRPFNYPQEYTLAIMGNLPEKAIKLLPGTLKTAITDTGDSLLPESDFDKKIHWPKLGKDGRTVLLELNLTNPDQNAKTLQEVSGTFGYLVSKGEFSFVDLGIRKFEKGIKGNIFGAKILSASPSSLNIYVEAVKDSIKSATLFDEQGNKIDAIMGISWTSNYTTLDFSPMKKNQKLPLKGKVQLEMLPDFKVYELEFKLTDVPLYGT